MAYRVSGLDQRHNHWVVRAETYETAQHIAQLFKKEGYAEVKVKLLTQALSESADAAPAIG